MTSQVLNFLWLNLELPAPPDPVDGSIRAPMPERYIESIRAAGARHPAVEIDLWADSRRLTEKQFAYIKASIEDERPNVRLKDLRTIVAYDKEALYNKAETNPVWRWKSKHTLIWRQVDAAKILISLQGRFDQTFYADLDYAQLDIGSQEVQDKLKNKGMFIGDGRENQLWGFNRSRRGFFKEYYAAALKVAYAGENGWGPLVNKIDALERNGIDGFYLCFLSSDGSQAEQPGSVWRDGRNDKFNPLFISAERLASVFNTENAKIKNTIPSVAARPKHVISSQPRL